MSYINKFQLLEEKNTVNSQQIQHIKTPSFNAQIDLNVVYHVLSILFIKILICHTSCLVLQTPTTENKGHL